VVRGAAGHGPLCQTQQVPHVYRPGFGRILTVIIGAICLVALVLLVISDGFGSLIHYGAGILLIAGVCWALYWRPELVVEESGVTVRNVLRTIVLPWPSIQRIDTKWALTLFSAYGKYTVWAAPAPNRYTASRTTKGQLGHLPESTYVAGSVRPGDDPGSPSGHAALLVRRHWESLRDAGFLDDPKLERARPVVRWHTLTVVVGTVLIIATVLGAIL
jgi:hypothetical protein